MQIQCYRPRFIRPTCNVKYERVTLLSLHQREILVLEFADQSFSPSTPCSSHLPEASWIPPAKSSSTFGLRRVSSQITTFAPKVANPETVKLFLPAQIISKVAAESACPIEAILHCQLKSVRSYRGKGVVGFGTNNISVDHVSPRISLRSDWLLSTYMNAIC